MPEREGKGDLFVMRLDLSSEAKINPRVDKLPSLHDESKHRDWFWEERR
jgi:hypothetical protein